MTARMRSAEAMRVPACGVAGSCSRPEFGAKIIRVILFGGPNLMVGRGPPGPPCRSAEGIVITVTALGGPYRLASTRHEIAIEARFNQYGLHD